MSFIQVICPSHGEIQQVDTASEVTKTHCPFCKRTLILKKRDSVNGFKLRHLK